jgi:hypothetical protein
VPRATSGEKREEWLRRTTVDLLAELSRSPDGDAKNAVEEHAVRVDGLADDLIAVDPEGAVLFLGDLAVRILKALCEQTGADPLMTLQEFALPPSEVPPH